MRLIAAQYAMRVGDIDGNTARIKTVVTDIVASNGDDVCIIFPELAVCGYPPEDLLLRDGFVRAAITAADDIGEWLQTFGRAAVVFGCVEGTVGQLYNAARIYWCGQLLAVAKKRRLPNDSVFDERRYFVAGDAPTSVTIADSRYGILICEDFWHDDTVAASCANTVETLIVINASPFTLTKQARRLARAVVITQRYCCTVAYVNTVGGQDTLLFDGASFLVTNGHCVGSLPAFAETVCPLDLVVEPPLDDITLLWRGLRLAIHEYVYGNGFSKAVLGLSGGIDSAVTLALAVDALGADNVSAVLLPTVFTSEESIVDAKAQCVVLQVKAHEVALTAGLRALTDMVSPTLGDISDTIAYENMQARLRAVVLMTISNATGALLLSTSNKSEVAVGYTTLYGDMCGAFAPLQDVLKGQVYQLAHYANTIWDGAIPARVITRAPSAELRPNQRDDDSLPPYDIVDAIITAYMHGDMTMKTLDGIDAADIQRVCTLIRQSEYKRYQAPPGPKVSDHAFGKDWRYPLTDCYSSK